LFYYISKKKLKYKNQVITMITRKKVLKYKQEVMATISMIIATKLSFLV